MEHPWVVLWFICLSPSLQVLDVRQTANTELPEERQIADSGGNDLLGFEDRLTLLIDAE